MQTEPPKADPPNRKRRWFQYSLRTLLIGVTLLAVACSYVAHEARIVRSRQAMILRIKAAGGDVLFLATLPGMKLTPMITHDGKLLSNPLPTIPPIRRWLGDSEVVLVNFHANMGHDDVEQAYALFPEAIKSEEGGEWSITYRTSPP